MHDLHNPHHANTAETACHEAQEPVFRNNTQNKTTACHVNRVICIYLHVNGVVSTICSESHRRKRIKRTFGK